MDKRNWFLAIGLGLLGFVIGGLIFGAFWQAPGYVPPLKVVGDVARVVKLEDLQQLGKLHHVSYDGHKYQAIRLMDIITAAQPIASPEQIYLVGSDGFTSSFPAQGWRNPILPLRPKMAGKQSTLITRLIAMPKC